MALVDFATKIRVLDVSGDAPYSSVVTGRKDSTSEKDILTMIDVVRSYLDQLNDEREARIFHYTIHRMLAGMSDSPGTYADPTLVTERANAARDAALAHYQRRANPTDI